MGTRIHHQRSNVWLAFTPDGKESEKAICRVCNFEVPQRAIKLADKCKTDKLWKHLNREHPEVSKMLTDISQEDIINEGVMDQWMLASLKKNTTKDFTSRVWKFFSVDESDKNVSICCECNARVSRGWDKSTASMWGHIKAKHPYIYSSAHNKEEEEEEEQESGALATEKAAVKDQFLLYSARQNSYICKTCGTILRLESPDEQINTNRLFKHLDHIFHKRVQHGLETPKRSILSKFYSTSAKAEKRKKTEEKLVDAKKFPAPVSAEKIMVDRETDMMHCSVMMHMLYAQQKSDICCDCTILIPCEEAERSSVERRPVEKEDGTIEYFHTKSGYEFHVHACVLNVASGKMRTLMENSGSTTIMMHDASKEAMLAYIEIIYLGKLKGLMRMSALEICDIFCTAQFFDSSMVMKYLERECPDIIEKYITSEKSENPSYGKFSLLLSSSSDSTSSSSDKTGDKEAKEASISKEFDIVSPSGLSLLSVSNRATSKQSRRKRKPLSTTFRLVKNRKKEGQNEYDPELGGSQSTSNDNSRNGAGESHLDSGMKFEIQGDTAILRASPDNFVEDVNFNTSNDV